MKSFVLIVCAAATVSALAQQPNTALMQRARGQLTKNLADPYSAVIEGTYFGRAENGSPVLCGTINARNLIGAYTGRRKFLYMETEPKPGLAMTEGDGMYEVLAKFCAR